MEKTLNTIQTLAKVGKIVSKVIMVCCIVGACIFLAGIISLSVVPDAGIRIGGVTLRGMIENEAGMSTGQLYIDMVVGMITTAATAVMAYFAGRYFTNELDAGTPFTLDGAKEMFRLGIIVIAISLGSQVIAELVKAIMENVFYTMGELDLTMDSPVTMGIMFLVLSLFCRYGAELTGNKEA